MYGRNPNRLQRSLAWTMNPISLMVQDGERDGFHRTANLAAKVLRYDRKKEQTEEWLVTLKQCRVLVLPTEFGKSPCFACV